MKPTPDLSHIAKETFLQVYEPAGPSSPLSLLLEAILIPCLVEDTFILLDALEKDIPRLRELSSKKNSVPCVIEIGYATSIHNRKVTDVDQDQDVSQHSYKKKFFSLMNAVRQSDKRKSD